MLLGALVATLLAATLHATRCLGVRFLCMRLWQLRPRGTPAPAVTLVVLELLVLLLATAALLLAAAPQYATFGLQAYVDRTGDVYRCSLECTAVGGASDGTAPPPCANQCVASALAAQLLSLSLRVPMAATAQYFAHWTFAAAVALHAFATLVSRGAPAAAALATVDAEAAEGLVANEEANERTPVLLHTSRPPRAPAAPRSANGTSGTTPPGTQQWWAAGARPKQQQQRKDHRRQPLHEQPGTMECQSVRP